MVKVQYTYYSYRNLKPIYLQLCPLYVFKHSVKVLLSHLNRSPNGPSPALTVNTEYLSLAAPFFSPVVLVMMSARMHTHASIKAHVIRALGVMHSTSHLELQYIT